MEKKELLRALPKIDEVLRRPELEGLEIPGAVLADLTRETVDRLRRELLEGGRQAAPTAAETALLVRQAAQAQKPSLRPVINATGVALHTNLGRACLSSRAVEAAARAARNYSTLEYDLSSGQRGSRYSHVEGLLCRLTGAEGAMVVNNNAAAVLLILSAVCQGGEVIVSRGELVEIGGSFRIPEIMEQCGAVLREVGATNKTHLYDYERAVGESTRALLKVHTSNYRILGFSESVSLEQLAGLGKKTGLPVIEDLGSGCLFDLETIGVRGEPTVEASIRAGADIVSFSGDKLLGGPQAGIILGRKDWIRRLKTHPLTRAMRVDKMTLAALEATLYAYLDPKTAVAEIPTLQMLAASPETLRAEAEELCRRLTRRGVVCQAVQFPDQVGGGSLPTQLLPGWAAAVAPRHVSVDKLEERLRLGDPPIIGHIAHESYLLSLRTMKPEEYDPAARRVEEADQ